MGESFTGMQVTADALAVTSQRGAEPTMGLASPPCKASWVGLILRVKQTPACGGLLFGREFWDLGF